MPTQDDPKHPDGTAAQSGHATDEAQSAQTPGSKTPGAHGTARRPGPPKPVTFKDFASI